MPDWTDARRAIRGFFLTATVTVAVMVVLAGCASGPREQDLLPDEGPTTLEVYERHLSGVVAGWADGREPAGRSEGGEPIAPSADAAPGLGRVLEPGEPIAPGADAATRRSHEALDDLRRDFQRVPNPEILGYVFPHLAGSLPVPGYFTAFPLREGLHYAQPGEGVYRLEGAAP